MPKELIITFYKNYLSNDYIFKLNDLEDNTGKLGEKTKLLINRLIKIERGFEPRKLLLSDPIQWKLKYIINVFLDFIYKIVKYHPHINIIGNGKDAINKLISHCKKLDIYFDDKENLIKEKITDKEKFVSINSITKIKEMFNSIIKNVNHEVLENEYDKKKQEDFSLRLPELKSSVIDLINFVDEREFKVNSLADIVLNIDSDIVSRFIKTYTKTIIYEGNLIMKWSGISSGQYAQLKLFSRLYYFRRKNEDGKVLVSGMIKGVYDIILLLDEPDLYMHPEWQRTLIKKLIDFLKVFFADYKIQIIYSTNNPMTISDMPENNLVFLEKGEKNLYSNVIDREDETFAANIYDLYADGFFMKDFIGDLPKKVIEKVITEINGEKSISKERADKLANLILLMGDNVIKRKLIDMLSNKINGKSKTEWIDDMIKLLKKKRDNVRDKK